MKKIKVGQYYRHPSYRGTLYLGCGLVRKKDGKETIVNKKLIIVSDTDPSFIGKMVTLTTKSKLGLSLSDFYKVEN